MSGWLVVSRRLPPAVPPGLADQRFASVPAGALTVSVTVSKIGETRGTFMSQRLVPTWIIRLLTAGVAVLPIAICVILAVAALLGRMGDPPEKSPLMGVALAVGILWVIDLICLVLAQALNSLADSDEDQ